MGTILSGPALNMMRLSMQCCSQFTAVQVRQLRLRRQNVRFSSCNASDTFFQDWKLEHVQQSDTSMAMKQRFEG